MEMDSQAAKNRPRIVVLTPRFPYPVVGGDRLRIFKICEVLSRQFDLSLVSLCERASEMRLAIPNDGVFTSVERILMPRWRSWINCALALFSGIPLQVAYYKSHRFDQAARSRSREADVVLAHLIRTAEAARGIRIPKVLEMTDAISLNYERSRRHFDIWSLRSLLHRIEARRVRRYELKMLDVFDRCVFISPVDRDFLVGPAEGRAATSTLICTNGVDERLRDNLYSGDGRTIIFIGNLRSYQNADAVRYFVREIFPIVRSLRPDARFRIIGRIDARQKARLGRIPGVEVTGEVPDIRAAASGAAVGVCSVRIGAGVQNKLLEYMALGVPSVTTTVGLEGLGATAGVQLLVADDPSNFADSVFRVMQDRQLAHELSESGRKYVIENHVWEHALAPLRKQIALLLEKGRNGAIASE
jgi:glycosyltransferase involved in cell wall biosynthesis